VAGVSSISRELAAIRESLEQGALHSQMGDNKKGKDGAPPLIPIDFEAFLAGQDVSSDAE
jgi:hypothetical protein